MSKILITDFFGTLIPGDAVRADKLYGNHQGIYDQDYKLDIMDNKNLDYVLGKLPIITARYLDPFLYAGNQLVIATSMDSHDPANLIYQILISELIKYLSNHLNQVSLFFQSESSAQDVIHNLSQIATIYEKDGVLYGTDSNGFTFTIIKSKEQVFNYLSLDGNELYAIGDDFRDFTMLHKCMQMGGKSSIINENMLREISVEEIIEEAVWRDKDMELNRIVFNMFPEIDDKGDFFKRRIAIHKGKEYPEITERLLAYWWERRKWYYESLRNGSFDILDELRKNELYTKLCDYNSIVAEERRAARLDPEEWLEKVDMYHTFQDYNQRVLTKH